MAYKSSYTGPQIDQAVSNAVNMDVNPTAGHTDRVVSSGGVKSALTSMDNKFGGLSISTYSSTLDKTSDTNTYATGITWTHYAVVSFSIFNTVVADYPFIISNDQGISNVFLGADGTLTIKKTNASIGGTNSFYVTIIHD